MHRLNRINLVKRVLVGFWAIGLVYIFYLQIILGKRYAIQAKGFQEATVELLPERGQIYDRSGRLLAVNRSCFSVSVLPQYLNNKKKEAAFLLASFGVKDFNTTYQEFQTKKNFYWWMKKIDYNIGKTLLTKLKKNRLNGAISVVDDKDRYYPFKDIAASAIGFVGDQKPGTKKGWAGIEFQFDSLLRGKPGKMVYGKDALGNLYPHPSHPVEPAVAGCDIFLTLDLDIQQIAYEELKAGVENYKAISGSVLVMDCPTGEILAMVDYPDFDPNEYQKYPAESWLPFAVSCEFEPGSSFKLVILATALKSSNRDEFVKKQFDVSKGYIIISGKRIKDTHQNKILDFPGIFIHSSNIGVSLLTQQLNACDFYLMARRLGFGLPTGIELPGEASGYLDSPQKIIKPLRYANNAFGQGLRTTLLQLAAAYSAVANDGLLLKPSLIKEIVTPTRTVNFSNEKTVIRRALDFETANQIKAILARVVTEGTGTKAALAEFEVCGKTGTAQKLVQGKYSSVKSLMTFIGFFPKIKPKYLIAVLIDEPMRTPQTRFAGDITCPLFKNIATRIIRLKQSELKEIVKITPNSTPISQLRKKSKVELTER